MSLQIATFIYVFKSYHVRLEALGKQLDILDQANDKEVGKGSYTMIIPCLSSIDLRRGDQGSDRVLYPPAPSVGALS